MIFSLLTTAGLALGWMLSPDALVLLANGVGRSGSLFWAPLVLGAVVSLATIFFLHHPRLSEQKILSFNQQARSLGTLPAATVTIAARLSLALFLPTGMLVTAGFTFNETFVYWFPNFSFSFLLLGLILCLHLFGSEIALKVQSVIITLTVLSLTILIVAGLVLPASADLAGVQANQQPSLSAALFLTPVILFLGYDQFDYPFRSSNQKQASTPHRNSYFIVLIAGFFLLSLWGFVSLKHVSPAQLADSTIPYIISAREILGQPGRIVMGIAIISGTCGLVNALFLHGGGALHQVALHLLRPGDARLPVSRKIWPVFLSLFIAIFMANGLAGEEELTTFIYGALLLWLLSIGAHCFAASRALLQHAGTPSLYGYLGYLLSSFFPLSAVWLACSNQYAATLAAFCFLALASSALLCTGVFLLSRKRDSKTFHPTSGDIS